MRRRVARAGARALTVALAVTLAVVALTGVPRSARADDWRSFEWALGFEMSARYATQPEAPGSEGDRVHQGGFGLAARALGGKSWLLVGLGVDLDLGFEVPGGFVYAFHLLPVGVGVRLGGRNMLGVIAGGGLGGTIDRVPFAWELPVEAFLELDLGRRVRLHTGARATWTPGTEAREDGAASASFTDQLDLRLGLSFGRRADDHYARWGDYDYVGLVLREQQHDRYLGLVIALSIAAGGGGR